MKFREVTNNKIENLAGGVAYTQSPEVELVSLLLTSFVEDQFYSKSSDQLDRLKKLIGDIKDKKLIAKAIIYARNEFGLRSITHAATMELMGHMKGNQGFYKILDRCIKRPDDILEMVGYWKKDHKGNLPQALRKGINKALEKFDEYQLAKYRGENSTVKMVDVFNLTHPKPKTPERQALYKKLMTGELKSTQTWEAKLSKAGQKGATEEEVLELKANAWKDLLENKKLGYLALLKNVRNIIQQAPECSQMMCDALRNEQAIKKSLVFPFRFMTAAEALWQDGSGGILVRNLAIRAIDDAIEISLNNVPKWDGETLVVVDSSGSMTGKPIRIASLFAATLVKANQGNADLMLFSDSAGYAVVDYRTPVATLAKGIESLLRGGGTNFHTIFDRAEKKYDRVVILSDMQGWAGDNNTPHRSLELYKDKFGANPFIYSFDLTGHGSMQFKNDQVLCIAGFSDKIFNIVKQLEQDRNALLNVIRQVSLD